MISIKFIRNNLDIIKESLVSRDSEIDLELILDLDNSRRDVIKSVETFYSNRIFLDE